MAILNFIKFIICVGVIGTGLYYEYQEIKIYREERAKKVLRNNVEMEFQFSPRKENFFVKEKK
jgi:hypothetical protein